MDNKGKRIHYIHKRLKQSTNVKELQRALGSINVYGKFISQYAKLDPP